MTVTGIEWLRQALALVLMLSAPLIVAVAVVGLVIAIVQAVTQVQEQSVQFLCKLVALGLALLLAARWIAVSLVEFGERVFGGIAGLVP